MEVIFVIFICVDVLPCFAQDEDKEQGIGGLGH